MPSTIAEGIVERYTRLRAPRETGEERHDPHREPVDGAVDDIAVALLPQEAAQPHGRLTNRQS